MVAQLCNVAVKGEAQEDSILSEDHKVHHNLADQGWDMLDWRIDHPDPVVHVDVCKSIAEHVVKEGKEAMFEVGSCIWQNIMDYHHEESMADDENKEIYVVARAKGVGKEDEYKKSRNDKEQKRKEENYFP